MTDIIVNRSFFVQVVCLIEVSPTFIQEKQKNHIFDVIFKFALINDQ